MRFEVERAEKEDLSFETVQSRLRLNIHSAQELRKAPWALRRHYHPLLEREDIVGPMLIKMVQELLAMAGRVQTEKEAKAIAMSETHKVQLQLVAAEQKQENIIQQAINQSNNLQSEIESIRKSQEGTQAELQRREIADLKEQVAVAKEDQRKSEERALWSNKAKVDSDAQIQAFQRAISDLNPKYSEAKRTLETVIPLSEESKKENEQLKKVEKEMRDDLAKLRTDLNLAQAALQGSNQSSVAPDVESIIAERDRFREESIELRTTLEFLEESARNTDQTRRGLATERNALLRKNAELESHLNTHESDQSQREDKSIDEASDEEMVDQSESDVEKSPSFEEIKDETMVDRPSQSEAQEALISKVLKSMVREMPKSLDTLMRQSSSVGVSDEQAIAANWLVQIHNLGHGGITREHFESTIMDESVDSTADAESEEDQDDFNSEDFLSDIDSEEEGEQTSLGKLTDVESEGAKQIPEEETYITTDGVRIPIKKYLNTVQRELALKNEELEALNKQYMEFIDNAAAVGRECHGLRVELEELKELRAGVNDATQTMDVVEIPRSSLRDTATQVTQTEGFDNGPWAQFMEEIDNDSLFNGTINTAPATPEQAPTTPRPAPSPLLPPISDKVRESSLEGDPGSEYEPDISAPNALYVPTSEKGKKKRKREDEAEGPKKKLKASVVDETLKEAAAAPERPKRTTRNAQPAYVFGSKTKKQRK